MISNKEEFDKLRQATTDKLLLVLFVAEWDESSKILHQMIKEMPTNFNQIKFAVVDADQVSSLVEKFQIDSVPAVVLMHPHKQNEEVHQ